jgi:hypothetical protein
MTMADSNFHQRRTAVVGARIAYLDAAQLVPA